MSIPTRMVGGIALVLLAWAGVARFLAPEHGDPEAPACLSNMKQISIAMIMYSEDLDGRQPTNGPWMDVIQPHLKSEDMLHCPVLRGNDWRSMDYGYAMNRAVAGLDWRSVKEPGSRIMMFDSSNLDRNAVGGPDLLPRPGRHVIRREDGLFFHHERGNNVAYGDSHCKWRPEGHEWDTDGGSE